MRYKIIDVFQNNNAKHYIAKCLKKHSPQFIVITSPFTLCVNFDIINVNRQHTQATWATGEEIALHVLNSFDHFDKAYLTRR